MFKAVVLNSISRPSPEKVDGHKWPAADSPALSMVGRRRLDHVHALIDDVVLRGVPGDFAECGCWKGGVAAVAAAVLRASGQLRLKQQVLEQEALERELELELELIEEEEEKEAKKNGGADGSSGAGAAGAAGAAGIGGANVGGAVGSGGGSG